MTVIFVTYHDFRSNSSIQVFSLANRMVELGHRVHICVPGGKQTATQPGDPLFSCCTYEEALSHPSQFEGGPGGMVIHAWTPRENVRKVTEQLREKLGCPVFVHLEDHEDVVTASIVGYDTRRFLEQSEEKLDKLVPGHLSHPRRFRAFLESASGVTELIDRLSEFVPAGKPHLLFWPAHNDRIFREMPLLLEERRRLGIEDHETVLAYVGNVTSANREEVASLYLAVAILRRLGHPARLLRAGVDCAPLFYTKSDEMMEGVITLGQLDHTEIPSVVGMADFLVQPGKAGEYNDYRFPSKLPEFFSIGRPVLLPHTNLGRFVRDGEDAVVLREGHAMEIADRIMELIRDPEKRSRLSRGALEFCRTHFDWGKVATSVVEFYQKAGVSTSTTAGKNGAAQGSNPWNTDKPFSMQGMWLGTDVVKDELNRRISGDPAVGWLAHVIATYVKPMLAKDEGRNTRILLLGANEGHMERVLWQAGYRGQLTATDIADKALARAKAEDEKLGINNVEYVLADLNTHAFSGPFDLILAEGVLHHIQNIQPCLEMLEQAMAPHGVMAMVEFEGPYRFQLSELQMRWINAALMAVPRTLRPLPRDQEGQFPISLKEAQHIFYVKASEEAVAKFDPSEAVSGPQLKELVPKMFHVKERRGMGGPLLSYMTGHFDFDRANHDAFAADWLRMLMNLENTLISTGTLEDEFIYQAVSKKEMSS